MASDETRAEADGPAGRLTWRRVGDGPPLVLINGYAGSADDWDPTFLGALGGPFSVICPNNRGIGGSDLGSEPVSVDAMADDVLAILDHLELETAPIAGWSMGGFIAQELAALAPERVEALVLISSRSGGPEAISAPAEVWNRLTDHSGTPREQATRLIGLLFPPDVAEQIDRDFGEVVAEARAQLSAESLDQQKRAIEGWHTSGREPPTVPVLAAAGSLDQVVMPENSIALAAGEGDWLARFPGCGHAFMAQEPVRVAALIAAFLR
ncbi:MAG: alpha/beta fold hydrolase [Solirubrobacterales bacterium]